MDSTKFFSVKKELENKIVELIMEKYGCDEHKNFNTELKVKYVPPRKSYPRLSKPIYKNLIFEVNYKALYDYPQKFIPTLKTSSEKFWFIEKRLKVNGRPLEELEIDSPEIKEFVHYGDVIMDAIPKTINEIIKEEKLEERHEEIREENEKRKREYSISRLEDLVR